MKITQQQLRPSGSPFSAFLCDLSGSDSSLLDNHCPKKLQTNRDFLRHCVICVIFLQKTSANLSIRLLRKSLSIRYFQILFHLARCPFRLPRFRRAFVSCLRHLCHVPVPQRLTKENSNIRDDLLLLFQSKIQNLKHVLDSDRGSKIGSRFRLFPLFPTLDFRLWTLDFARLVRCGLLPAYIFLLKGFVVQKGVLCHLRHGLMRQRLTKEDRVFRRVPVSSSVFIGVHRRFPYSSYFHYRFLRCCVR